MINYILKNATIINLFPTKIFQSDIRISSGKISEVNKNIKPKSEDEIIDCSGKFVIPGFVNSHTHLYMSLGRGMKLRTNRRLSFIESLRNIWWKYDELLDEDLIYYSALVGSIEALKSGTTTIINQHSSPNYIKGSLNIVKQALNEVGLRGILSYETTDRTGSTRRNLALDENERFLSENMGDSRFKGLIGAHASFTLSDESLKLIGVLAKKYDTGVHIHVAEDKLDVYDCEENYGKSILRRLNEFDLLQSQSIIAQGLHLSSNEIKLLKKKKCWLVSTPRSNMNNNVGFKKFDKLYDFISLGTDELPLDILEELRIVFLREDTGSIDKLQLLKVLQNGQEIISNIFLEKFGKIEKGYLADLVVLNYNPSTPIDNSNFAEHLIFGLNNSNVESVMVAGKWIMWYRQILGIDEESVMAQSRKLTKNLWNKLI